VDYSFVTSTARIALYDDMLSSPRIIEVPPAETMDFIGALSSEIYNQAREMGGGIPFSAIRQVTENFIHADFREIVVSIMDEGNTIRFTDQGPGIPDKERAQLPGFSSANEHMKRYIDGVGSGLPIVREYLDVKQGTLTLDDNLNGGSVVTLSLVPHDHTTSNARLEAGASVSQPFAPQALSPQALASHAGPLEAHTYPPELVLSSLSRRSRQILALFTTQDMMGVQDISEMTDIPLSSTHAELRKLEEAGLIEKLGKKRVTTPLGQQIVGSL
jgi:Signal transduction histidine kinase